MFKHFERLQTRWPVSEEAGDVGEFLSMSSKYEAGVAQYEYIRLTYTETKISTLEHRFVVARSTLYQYLSDKISVKSTRYN
jgi:hypothetical protein